MRTSKRHAYTSLYIGVDLKKDREQWGCKSPSECQVRHPYFPNIHLSNAQILCQFSARPRVCLSPRLLEAPLWSRSHTGNRARIYTPSLMLHYIATRGTGLTRLTKSIHILVSSMRRMTFRLEGTKISIIACGLV